MRQQVITFTVNGMNKEVYIRNSETLIHTLRHKLGLMGAKPACNNGDCGACTVLINGVPYNACHTLTAEIKDLNVTTIEGLDDKIIQNIFIKNWALQCGYCTPGFVLNCYALVHNYPEANDAVIEEWLDSNICRCTGYQEIKESFKEALNQGKAYG